MTGTVLSLHKLCNGRIILRSDIPDNMSEDERAELISTIKQAMTKLRGNMALPVTSCIRQIAFGAVLCSANLGEALRDFRGEAELQMVRDQ